MAVQGPLSPSSFSQAIIGGSDPWSNLANFSASGATYATCGLSNGGAPSETVSMTGFGFTIPSTATVNGIQLSINRKSSVDLGIVDRTVSLRKAGVIVGTDKSSATPWGTADLVVTYGNSSDLWGTTWTPADINAANFGVGYCIDLNVAGAKTGSANAVTLTVTYTDVFNGFYAALV